MKKINFIGILFPIMIIPCLVYCATKFYCEKQLIFNSADILGFTIIVSLILLSFVFSSWLLFKFNKLNKQNIEMMVLLDKIDHNIENNHYENIAYQQNTRELFLDDYEERDRV